MHFLLLLASLNKILSYPILAGIFLIMAALRADAQLFELKGVVYDSTKTFPLQAVSVLSTSGRGTSTDAFGQYQILVKENDSVWFSYLNKPTIKYAVSKIFDASRFDIALHVNVPSLKEVIVKNRNYRLDSIQNRIDYAKVFNWEKPGLKSVTPTTPGAAVGFDLEEIIRLFQFRKNRSMTSFKERLLKEEQDKFVDHRFNKALILRLTGLNGEARDSFMTRYRPSYEFCVVTSDYEFQSYIKKCYELYLYEKRTGEFRKQPF